MATYPSNTPSEYKAIPRVFFKTPKKRVQWISCYQCDQNGDIGLRWLNGQNKYCRLEPPLKPQRYEVSRMQNKARYQHTKWQINLFSIRSKCHSFGNFNSINTFLISVTWGATEKGFEHARRLARLRASKSKFRWKHGRISDLQRLASDLQIELRWQLILLNMTQM